MGISSSVTRVREPTSQGFVLFQVCHVNRPSASHARLDSIWDFSLGLSSALSVPPCLVKGQIYSFLTDMLRVCFIRGTYGEQEFSLKAKQTYCTIISLSWPQTSYKNIQHPVFFYWCITPMACCILARCYRVQLAGSRPSMLFPLWKKKIRNTTVLFATKDRGVMCRIRTPKTNTLN